ncbi:Oidioi.mRNA.OKI2018_I69.chr2.g7292.t1.cds [Oikopleura dioica]|uniref:Oidioi.mRNA.OKI2018_I69.chr2.g7292.t1.cds n=1 Tax=Oikopleura dioica TaxID=34765 RepID=A0ABN7TAF6_OIKDI|nr:Oidioi.mRNA.OKI2018_I69.chr2.g7292.t1.cds [Oikopleura dioica]
MATEIPFEAFERLLEDDVFCDYFNKFCSLPLFGQRVVYVRSEQSFFLDPEMKDNLSKEQIAKWCWETRMKFFLKSYIYAEYKLAKMLTKFNLSTEAAIHKNVANQLCQLQKRSFNRMSRFSKFCTFLNENGEGIKLVAFFISAQHVLLHHHENDQDSQFFLADLRDKFFDETSNWCLPRSLIEILGYFNDSLSTIDHCKKISQQVLNRLCTYWLPRYLLHVKVEEQKDENDSDDPSIIGLLKNLVASTSRLSSEDLGRAFSNTKIDDDPSMNLFFEPTEEINSRRPIRRLNQDSFTSRETASRFALDKNFSGIGINVTFAKPTSEHNLGFRQTRSRLTFAELGQRRDGGASILRNSRRELGIGETRGKKLSQINLQQKEKQNSNKPGAQSMTNIFSRMANVKKAINKFKKPEQKAPPPKLDKGERSEDEEKVDHHERRTVRGTVRQSASIASLPNRTTKKSRATKSNDQNQAIGLVGKKIRYKMGNEIMEMDENKDQETEEKKEEETINEEKEEPPPRASKKAAPGFASIIQAKSLALGWKKKVATKKANTSETDVASRDGATSPAPKLGGGAKGLLAALKAAKKNEEEQPKQKEEKITGSKMLFAMSANADEENQKVKVITKRENRLEVHDDEINDEDTLRNSFMASINPQILNRRRNAIEKIRPLKTLKKRHLLQHEPTVKQEPKKEHTRKNLNDVNDIMDERSRRLGRKKKEFIEKALKVSTFTEKIRVNFGAGDQDPESIYSIYEDSVFRHEMRHFKAALRSDEFAAGPFMAYLSEQEEDDTAVFALDFWQDIERFREEFGCMHQSELELEMENIINKYVFNNHAREVIPGMAIYSDYFGDIDILNTVTFPWQLRIVQRKCMDYLCAIWTDYIDFDVRNFCEALKILDVVEYRINATLIKDSIKTAFREEAPPIPLGAYIKATKEDEIVKARRARTIVEKNRKTKARKSSGNPLVESAAEKKMKDRLALMTSRKSTVQRIDLFQKDKEISEETKMARRSKRSYYLIEQTCRLTANLPKSHFLREESDDDGDIPDKAPPIYLRKPKVDPATLALMAAHDYPKEGSVVKKRVMVRQNDSGKVPSYMKATIRKNGVVFKRPILRPKHLVDCVRDPVHFEFFKRFARAYHFERSVRFWKAVEVMKHVEDPKVRQMKIKVIVSQFFSASSGALGVGIDGQVLREIMRTPPEKVNVSMLISAQACVMKALEDMWGERYLSTFTEVKKAGPHGPKEIGRDRTDLLKMTSGRNGTNIWKVFSAFIKRAARFVATMKKRELREEFEQYLLTVGRDPTLYHKEGWVEVVATTIDPFMANDKMFHQKRMQGRNVIAELLINDFRFWLEVECYRTQAEHVAQMGDSGVYNAQDEKNLAAKARLISDQFLSSPIPPKCRINVASEIASTVIENIKLGMANRSLFHDITIDVFPLLLNFWKSFCEARHKYIPRPKLNVLKRNIVSCRRKKQDSQKKIDIIKKSKTQKVKFEINDNLELVAKEEEPQKVEKQKHSRVSLIHDTSGDGPLIDYTKDGHFSKSWIDVSKVLEETTTVNFSLSGGVKVAIGLQSKPRKSTFHHADP